MRLQSSSPQGGGRRPAFGKTNVPLALGDFQSYNDIYGSDQLPGDVARTPGGSPCGGAAASALAAGFVPLELGSDIGGSLGNPAHRSSVCGDIVERQRFPACLFSHSAMGRSRQ